MNNPALYPPPHPYVYGNALAQGSLPMSSSPTIDLAQASFPPGAVPPLDPQRVIQRQPHQQQLAPHHLYPPSVHQNPGFARPQSRDHDVLAQGPAHSQLPAQNRPVSQQQQPNHYPTQHQQPPKSLPQAPSSTPTAVSNMAANVPVQGQANPNANLAQQAQIQNAAAQMARGAPQPASSLSPQSAARERARVSVLLEINTYLLQEVVSLQAQGKAGTSPAPGQQSPTSPTSGADPHTPLSNSPGGETKPGAVKAPSQEFADCMRRLQANLSYLAAIADAKKKANGALPAGPAIMVPPPHLPQVHDLYKKLNILFPEAGQSTINKAMAAAIAQPGKPSTSAQG